MARFRFKLQAVLDHREMVEEERQRAVAALERDRVRLENEIRARQREAASEKDIQRSALSQGAIPDARLQAAAAARVAAQTQRAAIELAGVLQRLKKARESLLEATKAKRAVELLRDRHLEEWRSNLNRAEASAVDELVVMRAGRKEDV